MKKCPYCSEQIQDEAIKCKHCGQFLEKKPEMATEAKSLQQRLVVGKQENKPNKTFTFSYQAKDKNGKEKSGAIDGVDQNDALNKLYAQDLIVISIKQEQTEQQKKARKTLSIIAVCWLVLAASWLYTKIATAPYESAPPKPRPARTTSTAAQEQESAYKAGYNFGYYGQRAMAGLHVSPEHNKPIPEKYRSSAYEAEVKRGISDGVKAARRELGIPLE